MIKEVNWNEVWKKAMIESTWNNREKDLVEFWNDKAKEFNKNIKKHNERAQRTISKLDFTSEDTMLDVGAGTGALSIPLAKIVKHITAVEPSKGMLDFFKENAEEDKLKNITYVNKKWEDIEVENDLEKYDVVFASYSISMVDIKEALIKMNEVAKKSVYLFTFAGRDRDELAKKLYGKEFISSPDYICIVNVLYQMGIKANVNISEEEYSYKYSNLDEAVNSAMQHYGKNTSEDEKIIRKYFSENLVKKDGGLCSKKKAKTATIWWTKN